MENINLKIQRCCKQPMIIMGTTNVKTTKPITRRQAANEEKPAIIYQCTKCGKGKIVEL